MMAADASRPAPVDMHHTERIDSLTALRFVAASMIVVWHLELVYGEGFLLRDHLQLSQGVSFFFVLSGFILAHVYGELNSWSATGRFWVARVARIWPVHLLGLALFVVLWPAQVPAQDRWSIALANLFLVHSWSVDPRYFLSFNTMAWTISVELFFYLTFPLLIRGIGRNWHWKLAIALAMSAAVLLAAKLQGVGATTLDTLEARGYGYAHPFARMIEFVLGMLAYQLFSWARAVPGRLSPAQSTALEGFAILLCVASMWQARFVFHSPTVVLRLTEPVAHWIVGVGSAVPFALLIVVFALQRGLLSRLLQIRVAVVLGEISYSMYLLHMMLATLLNETFFHFYPMRGWGAWIVYWSCLLLLCFATWRLLELPARRWINALPSRLARPEKATSTQGT